MPLTREAAEARLAERKSDEAFVRRYLDGGVAEKAEMQALHQAITNTTTNVQAEMDQRLVAQREQQIETWRRTADLPEPVIEQLRNQTPVSRAEYDKAVAEKTRLMKDKDFARRLYDGDREANTRWALCNIILGSRVV